MQTSKIKQSEIIVTRLFPSNGLCLSMVIDGVRVSRRYFGYSAKAAKREFVAEISA